MAEEKSKVETRQEFDTNAIKWGYRVGITDAAVAKSLYWCVLNIYSIQKTLDNVQKILDEIKKNFEDKKKEEDKNAE